MKTEKNDPAFPVTPIQDQFGRLLAPIAGMSKYEYVVLQIYAGVLANANATDAVKEAIDYAKYAANKYFDELKSNENEKEATTNIIQ